MKKSLQIVLIGSGNLATNLAKKLVEKKYNIKQVFSNQIENAKRLADLIDASQYTNQIKDIVTDADLYIFSLKDNILESVISQIPPNNGIWIHTAGSMPLSIFEGKVKNYGVFYPLQTFSKNKQLSWDEIPILIESNNTHTLRTIEILAKDISNRVIELPTDKRKYVHLSAVYACNFVNCMYVLGQNYIDQTELPFEILLPLIEETANKVKTLAPKDAQTGPAVRMDSFVIDKQLALITNPLHKSIYELISKAINENQKKN